MNNLDRTTIELRMRTIRERLNRLTVSVTHPQYEDRREEMNILRKRLNRLETLKNSLPGYPLVNYGEVIALSVEGRSRVGVYPYPKNPHDNIRKHNTKMKHIKFHKAMKVLKMRKAQQLARV